MIRFDAQHRRGDFGLDLRFEGGDGVTALFGPSGAGKSTILRLIAGLERPARGIIAIAGVTVLDTDAGRDVPPHRRGVGLVFQDAQLFPHLSVRANLGYGRFFARSGGERIALARVVEALGVGPLLGRRPATLSGGEKQRVALGRALLAGPRILLLDEPLAALDAERKDEILALIEQVRDAFGVPIVFVSHAITEVRRLAQTVVRIEGGRLVEAGPAADVLRPPRGA